MGATLLRQVHAVIEHGRLRAADQKPPALDLVPIAGPHTLEEDLPDDPELRVVQRLALQRGSDLHQLPPKAEVRHRRAGAQQLLPACLEALPELADILGILWWKHIAGPNVIVRRGLRNRRQVVVHGCDEALGALLQHAWYALPRQAAVQADLLHQVAEMGLGPLRHVADQYVPPLGRLGHAQGPAECWRRRRVERQREGGDRPDEEQDPVGADVRQPPGGAVVLHEDGQREAHHASEAAPSHDCHLFESRRLAQESEKRAEGPKHHKTDERDDQKDDKGPHVLHQRRGVHDAPHHHAS
mmetsp:Transcript_43294/g.108749  ORF Transcript_43294/g.108749 Transcript_43294/m.108749 type:complete len:299 (+) Transcript_43294:866-1762(+)